MLFLSYFYLFFPFFFLRVFVGIHAQSCSVLRTVCLFLICLRIVPYVVVKVSLQLVLTFIFKPISDVVVCLMD